MWMTRSFTRKRNRRGQGPRLRAEIVDAATALIAHNGPDGLTLRAVAREAGITAPSIYPHFSGLDAVLEAVVDNMFAMLADYIRQSAGPAADPVSRLRAACHAYVGFGQKYPNEYAIMFTHKSELIADSTEPTVANMPGAEAFDLLLEPLRDCVASGASRSTNAQGDATALWVALHGYISLNTSLPRFPWPAGDTVIDILITHVAQLN
jgi:AcrR family transcriptional regulator